MENDGSKIVVDLFGDPIRVSAKGRRGRPAHQPTQHSRDKVALLLAVGWSDERIAHALQLKSTKTLRKHYAPELRIRLMQRDRLDALVLEKLSRQAFDGDAVDLGALKELRKELDRQDRFAAARRLADAEPDPEPVGKKERARRDAEKAVGDGLWDGDLTPGAYRQ